MAEKQDVYDSPGSYTWNKPDYVDQVDIVVVGGGGGGGEGEGGGAGGGGAGGVAFTTGLSVSNSSYNIDVGDGGNGANLNDGSGETGGNGADSRFGSTIIRGRGGGGGAAANSDTQPNNGGSGGGTADNETSQSPGSATQPGTNGNATDYGNDGGGVGSYNEQGCGGGGATQAGQESNGSKSGDGGDGVDLSGTFGTNVGENGYFGGGGGGGTANTDGDGGNGGYGGGGNGAGDDQGEQNGQEGTGGGGGGGTNANGSGEGGNGGCGVVIIRYEDISPPTQPRNASITVDANDQITFNWDDPSDWGGERGNYRMQMMRDGDSWEYCHGGPNTVNDDGSANYSATYGPESDDAYKRQVGIDSSFRFRVRAENSAGNSGWDYSSTKYTDPIPPHNPSVSRPDANTINISATIQADQPHSVVVKYREDTGSGYGSWNWYDTWYSSEVNMSTGNRITVSYSVGTQYDGGVALQTDSRYQFRLYQRATDTSKHSESVYADYGNNGNVYFEDDFESNDLSAWRNTPGAYTSSGSGMDSGFSSADQGTYYAVLDGDSLIDVQLPDLSNESDVIVKAAVAVGSADDSSEELAIDFWDGNNWQQLTDFHWEYNKQGWVEVTTLVPDSYLGGGDYIQFDSESGGGGDHYYIDRVVVSDILHEYTKPAAPSSLSLDNSTEDEITATWTNNDSFAALTGPSGGHDIRYRKSGTSSYSNTSNTSGSTITVTGLPDGEKYDINARAFVRQDRNGNFNDTYIVSTSDSTTTTKLPAPTSLSVSNIGPDSADLSWTDNADNEDAYRVLVEEDGNPTQFEWSGLGTAESIDVGEPSIMPQKFTIEYVVEMDALDVDSNNNYRRIVVPSTDSNFLLIEDDGKVSFRVPNVDGSNFTAGDIVADGGSHRVTCVYDQSDRIIYINGSEVGRQTIGSGTVDFGSLIIGSNSASKNPNGRIRGVTIWGDSLTSSEIGSGVEPPRNRFSDVIGYWPLDQNNDGTTPDLSEYSNDGTVNGPTIVGAGLTDKSGALGAGTTSYNLSSLLETTTYEAYVQAETEHSVTRDM